MRPRLPNGRPRAETPRPTEEARRRGKARRRARTKPRTGDYGGNWIRWRSQVSISSARSPGQSRSREGLHASSYNLRHVWRSLHEKPDLRDAGLPGPHPAELQIARHNSQLPESAASMNRLLSSADDGGDQHSSMVQLSLGDKLVIR